MNDGIWAKKVRAWQFEMDFQVLDCKQGVTHAPCHQTVRSNGMRRVIFINRFDIWHLRTALVHRMGAAGQTDNLYRALSAGTTPGIS